MPIGKKPRTVVPAPTSAGRGVSSPTQTTAETVVGGGAKLPDGVSPSLVKVVVELSKRRARIDALDTSISDLIKRIEETLRAHVSTRVDTIIGGGPTTDHPADPNELYAELLVFGKHDGRWQLLIETGRLDEDEGWKTTPLLSSPRELRASVFAEGHAEKLVRGALAQLDEQIKGREQAHALASSLAAALGGPDDDIEDVPQYSEDP